MNKKDLEKHFWDMTKQFYLIGGVNDPSLKQTFLSSIPNPLVEESYMLFTTASKTLQNTTLGELY